MAGLVHRVYHSSAQGIPLSSQVNQKKFKVIPCDVGLYQRLIGGEVAPLIVADQDQLINKGAIAEIITGTELLSYSSPKKKSSLYYWHRESRGSNAEVDYLIEHQGKIVPIEVKSVVVVRCSHCAFFLKHIIPLSEFGLLLKILENMKTSELFLHAPYLPCLNNHNKISLTTSP